MTGRELIDWIHKNNAEDLECVVQYRDDGGCYSGGEVMKWPVLANYKCEYTPYDVKISYGSMPQKNCIVF